MTIASLQDIVDVISTFAPADNTVRWDMTAWPYSRNLILTTCVAKGLEYSYERLNKQRERFYIKTDEGFKTDMKAILRYINSEANKSSQVSKVRNHIVKEIIEELTDEKPTAKKPTSEKSADEKPTAKKPADEKPTAKKPAAKKPAAKKPAAKKPAAKKPAAKKKAA